MTSGFSLRRLLFGSPLRTDVAVHERLPILLALPIFAADALSSVAYATEAILKQWSNVGLRHDQYVATFWISLAIVTLILLVVVSYRQVIYAYPRGGGSYLVARENLGLFVGLVAAAALLVDYVLTVSVSIAECAAASFSALDQFGGVFTSLSEHRVGVCVILVLLIMLVNLRGVRESGLAFAFPSYGFILLMFTMIGIGLYRAFVIGEPVQSVAMAPDPSHDVTLTPYLILRGFASGCAALTGIEAVSNGVTAFRAPEARNASITLAVLGVILAALFTGVSTLALRFGIGVSPTEETVVSQIARAACGTAMPLGIIYFGVQFFTALILFLAANTAFAGFPRLASVLAEDGFLPRQLAALGDRLAFNNGIIVLSGFAIFFLVVFDGNTHALLPLYTVGVFVAFTTAQFGMVRRHLQAPREHIAGLIVNSVGGVTTLVVLLVVTRSKFIVPQPLFGTTWFYEGAWMALTLMAFLVWMFYGISRHYQRVDRQLAEIPEAAHGAFRHTVIVLVPSRIHRGIVQAIRYARSISPDALAVHIQFDPRHGESLRKQWAEHGEDMPLLILDSPFRSLVGPLMRYLDAAERVRTDDIITVVLPEFVPARWWHNFLHNASGWLLRFRLHYRPDIVIVSVRYYLHG
jgi:amino acid transporter